MWVSFPTVSLCVPVRQHWASKHTCGVWMCLCVWAVLEGQAARRAETETESGASGVSSGVIGMSGSKIWDEAGPRSLRGLEICACTRRANTGGICRQLCVCGGGEGLLLRTGGWGCGAGWWCWVVVKRERRGGGVDLQSEHNQPSVFIRLVVCESRNKCV